VELRSITYSSGGLKVKGFLALPKQGERLPCVIYNRGGNASSHARRPARGADPRPPRLVGYVAVASLYRGNGGGEGREEFGGRDVDDVLNLLPLLDALPRADATVSACTAGAGADDDYLASRGPIGSPRP